MKNIILGIVFGLIISFAIVGLLFMFGIFQINKSANTQSNETSNYLPGEGYVQISKTAIIIAEAVCSQIYGEELIDREKPFVAKLNNEIWTVSGSLSKSFDNGGVAEVEISKKDGKILKVIHGK